MTVAILRTNSADEKFTEGNPAALYVPSPEPHGGLTELVMLCAIYQVVAVTGIFVWPDGFTQLGYWEYASGDIAAGIAYKWATVNEPHEYLVSHSGVGQGTDPELLVASLVWEGHDAGVFDDVSVVTNSDDAPSVDIVHRNCHVALFGFRESAVGTPIPALTGYDLIAHFQTEGDRRILIWLSSEAKQPPSEDPPLWTGSGTMSIFVSVSFVPQGSGGDAWVDLEVI